MLIKDSQIVPRIFTVIQEKRNAFNYIIKQRRVNLWTFLCRKNTHDSIFYRLVCTMSVQKVPGFFFFNNYKNQVVHYLEIYLSKFSPPDDMQWSQRACHFLKVFWNCSKVKVLRSVRFNFLCVLKPLSFRHRFESR